MVGRGCWYHLQSLVCHRLVRSRDVRIRCTDACGLSEGSAEDSPLGVKKPKKPNLRLSQLARSIKSDTARKVIFDPTLELSAARDEIARLRRSNQMQAQFIETLKHKNEVLEQRLALRDFV